MGLLARTPVRPFTPSADRESVHGELTVITDSVLEPHYAGGQSRGMIGSDFDPQFVSNNLYTS